MADIKFNLNINQTQKLDQRLILTPQQQMLIELLQIPVLDLAHWVEDKLQENPLLEYDNVVKEQNNEPVYDKTNPDVSLEELEKNQPIELPAYYENKSDLGYYSSKSIDASDVDFSKTLKATITLTDHLNWQLRIACEDKKDLELGLILISAIDSDGYFRDDLAELSGQLNTSVENLERILKIIQSFEPIGVGARNLKECLLIQLKYIETPNEWIEEVIEKHLEDLQRKKYIVIENSLKISLEKIKEIEKFIAKNLYPKPGRVFADEEVKYVIPDVIVKDVDGEYIIIINDERVPTIRINPYYLKMMKKKNLSEKTKKFLENKFKSALWILKCIHQRNLTLYRVTESIITYQKDFLEKGIEHIKPLKLKQIANKLSLHESTISRVTSNKYVQLPSGVFRLKYFFSSSLETETGELASSKSVKNTIKNIISEENTQKPLSDKEIAFYLKNEGIKIARRTVSKYREDLGILPKHLRKTI